MRASKRQSEHRSIENKDRIQDKSAIKLKNFEIKKIRKDSNNQNSKFKCFCGNSVLSNVIYLLTSYGVINFAGIESDFCSFSSFP